MLIFIAYRLQYVNVNPQLNLRLVPKLKLYKYIKFHVLFLIGILGMNPYTAKTKYRKVQTNISLKKNCRPQSQFSHSCVYARFIYSHKRSAFSAAGKYVDRSWEYINLSQTHECGIWGWGRAIPFLGYIIKILIAVYSIYRSIKWHQFMTLYFQDIYSWVRVIIFVSFNRFWKSSRQNLATVSLKTIICWIVRLSL